jgi:hypothetical protein
LCDLDPMALHRMTKGIDLPPADELRALTSLVCDAADDDTDAQAVCASIDGRRNDVPFGRA